MENSKTTSLKCPQLMVVGKFKTCEKCRKKKMELHYKNKDKYNERRKLHYYAHREQTLEYQKL